MDSINAPEVRVPVSSNISLPHTLAETAEVVCEIAPRERIRGLLPQSDRTFGSPKCLTLASVLNNNMNMQSRPFERSLFSKRWWVGRIRLVAYRSMLSRWIVPEDFLSIPLYG